MLKRKNLLIVLTVCLSFLLVTCSMPGNDASSSSSSSQEEKTFTTGITSVENRSISELCGLVEPADWQRTANFTPEADLMVRALPKKFDWRSKGKVPPVRNQGACGSCWAFGTIGAFESAIRIKKGISHDYSEQYLLSCNSYNYGCNGGWFDYYDIRNGAVMETCFPYVAKKIACKSTCRKYYGVSGAYYVGNGSSVPSTTAIKSAIYKYGPVAAAVYVNTSFKRYTGGTFNGTAAGRPNHAIVLVGWDDYKGAWILRNSWGSAWGIGGYMYIKYGSQNVGYAANYVIPK